MYLIQLGACYCGYFYIVFLLQFCTKCLIISITTTCREIRKAFLSWRGLAVYNVYTVYKKYYKKPYILWSIKEFPSASQQQSFYSESCGTIPVSHQEFVYYYTLAICNSDIVSRSCLIWSDPLISLEKCVCKFRLGYAIILMKTSFIPKL